MGHVPERLAVPHDRDPVGDHEQLVQPVRDVDDRDARGGQSCRTTPNSTWISVSVRIADGSSRMSTRASPASALAIETCCCSAIDSSLTATVAYRAGRPISSSFDDLGVLRGPVDPSPAGDLPAGEDVLGHRQVGEQLRFLVDGGDAERDGIGRGRAGHRGPRRDSPVSAVSARDTLISLDFPAPSRRRGRGPATFDRQVRVADRAHGAEPLGDPPDGQPGRGGPVLGRGSHRSGRPGVRHVTHRVPRPEGRGRRRRRPSPGPVSSRSRPRCPW